MKFVAWLRHALFGVPPAERWCHNCQFYDRQQYEDKLKGEHEILRHHLEIGGYHPKGKKYATGNLGWCTKNNYATEAAAVSCDFWREMQ